MDPGSLIIRADASRTIGAGHVMRCLALAEAWRSRGGRATLLGVCEISPLLPMMRSAGVAYMDIESVHPDPVDVDRTMSLLRSGKDEASAHWAVVDGYHFDPQYQEAVRDVGTPVLVVDDTAHLPDYRADLLVNQNVYAKDLKYRCDSSSLLLGCRYAMLRDEFLVCGDRDREIPEVAKKILVSAGGSDPNNLASLVIDALSRLDVEGFEAIIVAGGDNQHLEALRVAARQSDEKHCLVRVVEHSSEMPKLMAWADLAVTAGGTTCLESSYMGLPSIVVVTAANQERAAIDLTERGIVKGLGSVAGLESERIASEIRSLAHDPLLRRDMSRRGRELVDGHGTSRVVDRMLALSERSQGVISNSRGGR